MHIFDVLEAWQLSMEASLSAFGVIARFDRSSDMPNPSCCLNLRRDNSEADLVVWESGEAEFVVGQPGESISQTHFDDLRNRIELSEVLSKLVEFVVLRK